MSAVVTTPMITEADIDEIALGAAVLGTGATRIVVVRAVTEARDVTAAARELRSALPA